LRDAADASTMNAAMRTDTLNRGGPARARTCICCLALCAALAAPAPALAQDPPPAAAASPRDGGADFDFEIGRWRTQVKRLRRPLTGSDDWVEYEGTSVVHALLGGRANLVELSVSGPSGRIEGVALRLYDPQARRWGIHYVSAADGALTAPLHGGFEDGRGEFYGDDTLGDRPIRVRFVITQVDRDTARFEQAFSADGGATWEVNWIAIDTRQ
jgi:hypothetical protein